MAIRRIQGPAGGPGKTGKSKKSEGVTGGRFASLLSSASPVADVAPMAGVAETGPVDAVDENAGRAQRQSAKELLDSLEAFEKEIEANGPQMSRERLRETRDQALLTLSHAPKGGEERELLHRTAVLATVELAKNDRGDYR